MTSTTPVATPRMSNPATLLEGASGAIFALMKAARQTDLPHATLELVHLRTSQINGCSLCVESGVRSAKQAGESDERLHAVVAWRETPYFTDEECAALALAESVTRLADRPDAVPDEVWDEAASFFDERQLAALVLYVATTNLFNRLNATTRQLAGGSWS
ncbi:carboxymuconolactone decarboxylase family protein [Cellulosimicrobium cellulans]|uniref:carboxymuconolactone decarboxylase family protein n=1 Tax=Cellulosimicrobium cellulans TaxID=1710 RepID=UPI001964248A|nr:carboxymuconolactone decarboxylase family protein [Cellulosimicrobium cellulans]MBN0040350.1 carboxymuconolactone decarboxylase family protein [Cellulosimicrobium cellulans]